MDEIDRLKTFEPPEKSDDNKVNVKLFLEEDIRFLELDPDVSYEARPPYASPHFSAFHVCVNR